MTATTAPRRQHIYTLEEIDEQLCAISYIIKYGVRCNRANCVAQADKWLDRRLALNVKGGNNG